MDDDIFRNFLANNFESHQFEIARLAGDASDRVYYRVTASTPAFAGNQTAILMSMATPEPDPPFLSVQKALRAARVPAPDVLGHDLAQGLILLEDFGDVTLEQAVTGADRETWQRLYSKAIDILIDIQVECTARQATDDCVCFSLAFDLDKLMFEMDFFVRHVLAIYKGVTFTPGRETELRHELERLCLFLANRPRALCHRDYHSRNLMALGDGTLGVLDFQDARMGPLTYDLVSLLHDSYVDMPVAVRAWLRDAHCERLHQRGGPSVDKAEFEREYYVMLLQRNLKAAGSFAYLDCVKKMNRYLQRLGPCMEHVKSAFAQLPDFARLREMLAEYLDELK